MINGHTPARPEDEESEARVKAVETLEGVQPTLAKQMCIVIAFDVSGDDVDASYAKSREILQEVKDALAHQPNVKVWGAVNETASAIVKVLNSEIETEETDANGG